MAFLEFGGNSRAFDAVAGGTMNALGCLSAPFRADTGKITSAGVIESSAVKYEAMRVMLKGAVYTSLMRLPRSNMRVWRCLNSERKFVMSYTAELLALHSFP